nr:hypothetical protein [Micromonospora sp. DSM 115978]
AAIPLIDRDDLRTALRELVVGDYWVLAIDGRAQSGRSHSWQLLTHARDGLALGPAKMVRLARVTTEVHNPADRVRGEDLARSLAARLDLAIDIPPSDESSETRTRLLVDRMIGAFPQSDGVTRWIFLDGLDRPNVLDCARDFARRIVDLVLNGDLSQTRLVVTGLE